MKVLILNGARITDPHLDAISAHIGTFFQQSGWDTTNYTLRDHHIKHCIGCFECWTKTPGECIINNDHRHIAAQTVQSDLVMIISPVTFGGYSSETKKMLDHLIPLILPFFQRINGETHHQARYDRYPAMLGIGIQQKPNPTQADIFRKLVHANGINMHSSFVHADVWLADRSLDQIETSIGAMLHNMLAEAVS